ncbi:hypothetical protein CR983_02530 [Candidatus Saccharibacteria bacterium]|nr:MAG: hypothetical protein CR983_02530 [Candidatus Saccharibacteria bacterium]
MNERLSPTPEQTHEKRKTLELSDDQQAHLHQLTSRLSRTLEHTEPNDLSFSATLPSLEEPYVISKQSTDPDDASQQLFVVGRGPIEVVGTRNALEYTTRVKLPLGESGSQLVLEPATENLWQLSVDSVSNLMMPTDEEVRTLMTSIAQRLAVDLPNNERERLIKHMEESSGRDAIALLAQTLGRDQQRRTLHQINQPFVADDVLLDSKCRVMTSYSQDPEKITQTITQYNPTSDQRRSQLFTLETTSRDGAEPTMEAAVTYSGSNIEDVKERMRAAAADPATVVETIAKQLESYIEAAATSSD